MIISLAARLLACSIALIIMAAAIMAVKALFKKHYSLKATAENLAANKALAPDRPNEISVPLQNKKLRFILMHERFIRLSGLL